MGVHENVGDEARPRDDGLLLYWRTSRIKNVLLDVCPRIVGSRAFCAHAGRLPDLRSCNSRLCLFCGLAFRFVSKRLGNLPQSCARDRMLRGVSEFRGALRRL